MAGKRMVYEEMCVSVKFSQVSAGAERLWTRILTKTDDNGNFHATPTLVRGLCLPQLDVMLSDVKAWVDELANVGLVSLYEYRGETFLHITGFFKYQTLRKDRKQTIKYPLHPENLDDNSTPKPAGADDDDFIDDDRPVDTPGPRPSTDRPVLFTTGKPLVNHPQPLVNHLGQSAAEEKLREVKRSEEKLSEGAGGQSASSQTNPGSDWSNLRRLHRNTLGRKPDKSLFAHKYAAACETYGEEVVLACFAEWGPTAKDWVRDKNVDHPLHAFFKKLPDMAIEELADRDDRQAEAAQSVADAAKTQQELARREAQVVAARKADADKWDSMTKPSTENVVTLADYLEGQ